VLAKARWPQVFGVVRDRLMTPSVCGHWLPGTGTTRLSTTAIFARVMPPTIQARSGDGWRAVRGCLAESACPATWPAPATASTDSGPHERGRIGTLSEVFDAEKPYMPRGCIAQAWSVAEVLRAWLATEAHPKSE
jgi:hypothetical protein